MAVLELWETLARRLTPERQAELATPALSGPMFRER